MEIALFIGALALMCLVPGLTVYAGWRHISKALGAIAKSHGGQVVDGPTQSRYRKMVMIPNETHGSIQFWFEGVSNATTHLTAACALPDGWGAFELRTCSRQFAYALDEGEDVISSGDAAFDQSFVVMTTMPEVAPKVLTPVVLALHRQHPHLQLKVAHGVLQLISVHKSPSPELVEVMLALTALYRDAVVASSAG